MQTLFLSLAVAASIGLSLYVAFRSRRALRDLWREHGALQQRLQHLGNVHSADLAGVYSELASGYHQKPVQFQSQSGEDIWLWKYFERKTSGVCIEVGAFDGRSASNTAAFENLGWRCFLIEPDPEMAERCRQNRPASEVFEIAAGPQGAQGTIQFHQVRSDADWAGMMSFTSAQPGHLEKVEGMAAEIATIEVPYRSLNEALKDRVEGPIDFVSIDVEGSELDVFDGFDLDHFRPEVILVEVTYDRKDHAIAGYLGRNGYRLEATVGCNEIYVRGR